MNQIEICIAFIVSIVSIGTPMVFQVVSKFDEKYHSEKIIDLFKKESCFKLLKWLLIAVPIPVLLYIITSGLLLYSHIGIYSQLLNLISFILLVITFFLVGQFIFFSFKVLKYSIPSSFIKGRIKYLRRTKTIEKKDFLTAATNFFQYSIQRELIDTCTLMPDYMFQVFLNYRKKIKDDDSSNCHVLIYLKLFSLSKKYILKVINFLHIPVKLNDVIQSVKNDSADKLIKFPDGYYETTNVIAQELALKNSIRLKNLDYYASGFYWLVGSVEDTKISKETYNQLWLNLSILIVNEKDEMVFKYWELAVHHFEFNLQCIDPVYKSFPDSLDYLNQNDIDKREKEREEFLEFHYYLGGLLLYETRTECIRKIWVYTNSEPPIYPLLPFAMGDIFQRYFEHYQIYNTDSSEKAARFNFPKVDSIFLDWVVNSWIRKYLILLFLRQYTLHKYYTYQEFLELPQVPLSQAEKKRWIDNIQGFKNGLVEILDDTQLLKTLGLDNITEEWCEKEGKPHPLKLIDTFNSRLEEEFGRTRERQSVSIGKENKFLESSKKIIESTFEEYIPILNKSEINDSFQSYSIYGLEYPVPKSDFAEGQGYDHFNYDSFAGESLANRIQLQISSTFSSIISQSYLFLDEDVFSAIDRLKISELAEKFIIISFRRNIDYYIKVLKIPGLSIEEHKNVGIGKYKGIQLINIWNCNDNLVGGTFFILKKSDLPSLIHNEPSNKRKTEYKKEEQILPHIYASIIDLHLHEYVRLKLEEESRFNDLHDKVLVLIEMNTEIRWKRNSKIIAFRSASAYEDRGIPNKIEEVKPFDKM